MNNNFCPCCDSYPSITFTNNIHNVQLTCDCGFDSFIEVKEYLQLIPQLKSTKCAIRNIKIQKVKEEAIKAQQFMDNYFIKIKQRTVNNLLEQINKLESSFEISYKCNKSILSLLNVIIDNYRKEIK